MLTEANNRIKSIRSELGLSRKEFESKSGISANTLRAWEIGANPITAKVARKLTTALARCGIQCQPEWILSGNGIAPRTFSAEEQEQQNKLMLNFPEHDWNDETAILKEIQFFETENPNAIVVTVPDDSMLPIYCLGEYVGGIRFKGNKLNELIGESCIIESNSGDIYIRKLQKGSKRNLYTLYPLNPNTNTEEPIIYNLNIKSAAKIIWHRKQL